MPKKKLTKKNDTTIVKTEVHVKSYDRKPFKVKKKTVNPKRTKSHNRLISSLTKLGKDISRSITAEKKADNIRRKKAKVETKEQRAFRLRKEKLEEFNKRQELEAKHTLAELKRREEILDAKHAEFDAKSKGLLAVDKYRNERLPVALGSPASQKIGAIKTRQIYEKAKSDIITDRAKAFQELAKVAKTRAEATQFLSQAAQLQAQAETAKSAEKRAVATDKKRALESLEAKTAVKLPSLNSPVRSLGQTVAKAQVSAEEAAKAKKILSEQKKQKEKEAKLEKELRKEAKAMGLPAQTKLEDIVGLTRKLKEIEATAVTQKDKDELVRRALELKAEKQAHTELVAAAKNVLAERRLDVAEEKLNFQKDKYAGKKQPEGDVAWQLAKILGEDKLQLPKEEKGKRNPAYT